MMSVSSWTIIVISLSCFTGVFMLTSFYILLRAWQRFRTGSSSPFRLTYSARKHSGGSDDGGHAASLSTRACSVTTLNAYPTDLAVEAERDARRVIEKSSVFEYWWDDLEETPRSRDKKSSKSSGEKTPSGRFFTHPLYHSSTKRESPKTSYLVMDRNMSVPEKMSGSVHSINKPKGDLRL